MASTLSPLYAQGLKGKGLNPPGIASPYKTLLSITTGIHVHGLYMYVQGMG